MLEPISFVSSIGKVIAAVWSNGSRLLWSIAGAAAGAAVVIRVGAYFEMPKAQPLWEDYGLCLMLFAVVVAVFAAFKMRSEQRNTGLALIANDQHSFWHHAEQLDGTINTQLALRFHATNMNDGGSMHLSKVRLNWPWVSRKRIITAMLMTQHPERNTYGSDFGIRAHGRRGCSASIVALGTIGGVGRTKPMRVSIGVQDHAGRWHKLVFRGLRGT